MGKINQGILGPFSGKVGTVVGVIRKGQGIMRAYVASIANPRTEAQVNQRIKFAAALAFLQPNLAFVKVGYKFYTARMSAFNAAQSYVLKNAITGTAPNFTVDYALALVSRGKLEGVLTGDASEAAGSVTATWSDNSAFGNARPDDKALLLVYNATTGDSTIVLEDPATRVDGTITTPVDATSGDNLQVYLAFQAADGSMVSDSTRVKAITVA